MGKHRKVKFYRNSTPLIDKCSICKNKSPTSHHLLCDSCYSKRDNAFNKLRGKNKDMKKNEVLVVERSHEN